MRRWLEASAMVLATVAPAGAGQTQPLTLADALEAATKNSMASATNALRDASDRIRRARSAPRTSLNTVISAQPMGGSPLQYLAAPEYTVDFGSAFRRLGTLQTAQSELAQSTATLAATQRATTTTVVDAFFDAAADQSQLIAQNDAVALAQRSTSIASLRHQQGVAPQLDVERAQAQLATVQAERDAARTTLADDLDALGELVGTASPPTVAVPTPPAALPDTRAVAHAALHANPVVSASQAIYSAAQAAAVLARAELAPGVTVGIGPGYSRVGSAQAFGPAGSVTLNVPVGSPLEHANVSAADAAVLVAQAGLDQSRRQATHDALHARSVADGALARLAKLQAADASARRVANADLAGYRLGAVISADLVVAETQASNARAALENARVMAARAYVNLQIEMGELRT